MCHSYPGGSSEQIARRSSLFCWSKFGPGLVWGVGASLRCVCCVADGSSQPHTVRGNVLRQLVGYHLARLLTAVTAYVVVSSKVCRPHAKAWLVSAQSGPWSNSLDTWVTVLHTCSTWWWGQAWHWRSQRGTDPCTELTKPRETLITRSSITPLTCKCQASRPCSMLLLCQLHCVQTHPLQ